jgi:hypothetical protein
MKIKTDLPREFRPTEVTILIETEHEAKMLFELYNYEHMIRDIILQEYPDNEKTLIQEALRVFVNGIEDELYKIRI